MAPTLYFMKISVINLLSPYTVYAQRHNCTCNANVRDIYGEFFNQMDQKKLNQSVCDFVGRIHVIRMYQNEIIINFVFTLDTL